MFLDAKNSWLASSQDDTTFSRVAHSVIATEVAKRRYLCSPIHHAEADYHNSVARMPEQLEAGQ
ncbi:MAG: hypothetical protein QGG09_03840, partial [Pirellulaceae bacterium]|nr:hypothetical protein [Pirellulaceae bacterium]